MFLLRKLQHFITFYDVVRPLMFRMNFDFVLCVIHLVILCFFAQCIVI